MFGTYANNPWRCPEPSLVPQEQPEDLAECCWCHERVDKSDVTQFSNGDLVCGDCLHDYLEEMGSEYYGAYAASQRDFIDWWWKEYITYGCQQSIIREAFEQLTEVERRQVQAAFALGDGQYFRDYVELQMGGVRLDRI